MGDTEHPVGWAGGRKRPDRSHVGAAFCSFSLSMGKSSYFYPLQQLSGHSTSLSMKLPCRWGASTPKACFYFVSRVKKASSGGGRWGGGGGGRHSAVPLLARVCISPPFDQPSRRIFTPTLRKKLVWGFVGFFSFFF